ncbi:MAG: hypothetical protein HDQ97_05970 [Lachnospiraceae bacterium]|nr:hypothetical protein [Lachnospiraceae bacterium]
MSQTNEIMPVNMPLRLVSADAVKNIICKYENRIIQRTMIYEIEKLNGCIATNEQALEITGNANLEFED